MNTRLLSALALAASASIAGTAMAGSSDTAVQAPQPAASQPQPAHVVGIPSLNVGNGPSTAWWKDR